MILSFLILILHFRMPVGRHWVLKQHYKDGLVSADDYEVVEEELPPLKDGEILVKASLISIDPYNVGPPVHNSP